MVATSVVGSLLAEHRADMENVREETEQEYADMVIEESAESYDRRIPPVEHSDRRDLRVVS